ncbi:hypothetical protein C1646_759560 [Rhizophagus diaphanus]|nr:hypothetical protein C1646_759560 [Rhizophagus diaphanus] [Rhizophagus sp. MUCL 43196]
MKQRNGGNESIYTEYPIINETKTTTVASYIRTEVSYFCQKEHHINTMIVQGFSLPQISYTVIIAEIYWLLIENENSNNLTWKDKYELAYQLTCAVLLLHDKGIVHRGLYLGNIFVHQNTIKLENFELLSRIKRISKRQSGSFNKVLHIDPKRLNESNKLQLCSSSEKDNVYDNLYLQDLVDYLQRYLIENKSEWVEQHFEFTQRISSQSTNLLDLQQILMAQSPDKILKSFDFISLSKNVSNDHILRPRKTKIKEIKIVDSQIIDSKIIDSNIFSTASNGGNRDGFTPKEFYELCDGKPNTVKFINVNGTEEILGGHNPLE